MRPTSVTGLPGTTRHIWKSIWRSDSLSHPTVTKAETRLFNRSIGTVSGRITFPSPSNTFPRSYTVATCQRHAAAPFRITPPQPSNLRYPFRRPFSHIAPRSSPPWNSGGSGGGGYENTYRRFGQQGSGWQNAPNQGRWYVYRRYLVGGGVAFGAFYVYNLETVEVRRVRECNIKFFFFG
jgi:hypothetical protein